MILCIGILYGLERKKYFLFPKNVSIEVSKRNQLRTDAMYEENEACVFVRTCVYVSVCVRACV